MSRTSKKSSANGSAKVKKPMSKPAIILLGIFLSLVLVGIVVGLYVTIYSISYVSGSLKVNLEQYKETQNQTSFIYAYDKNGNEKEVTRLYGSVNRVWVDIKDTNSYIAKCYVGLEDKRFYEHKGVDWTRTIAAIVKYGGKQGGSTITQQLIKNLTEEDDVSIVRKYKEILNALNLEKHYTKEQIIEAYLNTVYLSHGCYGVKTAAETYFGKEISECNLAESAALAVITKYPTYYDPIINPDNNKERRDYCLKQMYTQGLITKAEYDEAVNYKIKFQLNQSESQGKNVAYSYYTDALINQVIDDLMEQYGYTLKTASNMINYGGLKIYSAVDLDIQKKMDSAYTTRDYVADGTVQSSMTILAYDGRVVGIEGGIGEKKGKRELNRATDSPRQPGSTLKPLAVYGPGIDTGAIYWSKLYQNSASLTVDGKPWPKNENGQGDGSYLTVQSGLAQSLNTIAVRSLLDVGLQTSYSYLHDKFMLSHLSDTRDVNYSTLGVGALTHGATTLEMASAFQAYGNGGTYNQPYFYYKVEDSSGNTLLDRSNYDTHKAVDESTAEIMNKLLRTVMTSGTGTPYNVSGQTTFGKTGTTDDNKDRWFVGGTPYYVAAVWYGYDVPKEINNVWTNPSGYLFKTVMDKVHSGLSSKEFPSASSGVTEAYYCPQTGLLASNGCSSVLGYFRSDNMPGYCSGHYSSNNSTTSADSGNSSSTTASSSSSETTSAQTTSAAAAE